MTLISDILMIAAALGAAFYCVVLSRRLTRFTDLEKGMGGAIAVLSAQVDGMTRTLKAAQAEAGASGKTLDQLTLRAEEVARRLELNVAALHDMPAPVPVPKTDPEGLNAPVAFRRAPLGSMVEENHSHDSEKNAFQDISSIFAKEPAPKPEEPKSAGNESRAEAGPTAKVSQSPIPTVTANPPVRSFFSSNRLGVALEVQE